MNNSIYQLANMLLNCNVDVKTARRELLNLWSIENDLDFHGDEFDCQMLKAYKQAKADGKTSPLTNYLEAMFIITLD